MPTDTRYLRWDIQTRPTLNDLRSLVTWLEHTGCPEDHPISVTAGESQRDGWFLGVVVVLENKDAD